MSLIGHSVVIISPKLRQIEYESSLFLKIIAIKGCEIVHLILAIMELICFEVLSLNSNSKVTEAQCRRREPISLKGNRFHFLMQWKGSYE